MILFVCTTPFQIMNMLNIVLNELQNEKINVCILDHTSDCYDYYCILKESDIFNDVYFLRTKNDYKVARKYKFTKLLGNATKAFNAINYKKLEKKLPNQNTKYKTVFIAFPDLPSQIIYYFYKKKASSIKLNLYDDGLYTYRVLNKKNNWLRVLFSKLVFGSYILDDIKNVYVYKPSLLKKGSYDIQIKKIQTMDKENSGIKDLLNSLMGFEETHLEILKYDYIYFDQPFELNRITEQQKRVVGILGDTVGVEKIGLKLHPRFQTNIYSDIESIKVNTPFEILGLNSDLENKVLISVSSSACLNPKIIFNDEPYVILLFNLFDLSGINKVYLNFINEVNASYINKNRFFIPESYDELICVLKKIEDDLKSKVIL